MLSRDFIKSLLVRRCVPLSKSFMLGVLTALGSALGRELVQGRELVRVTVQVLDRLLALGLVRALVFLLEPAALQERALERAQARLVLWYPSV